MARNTTNLGLKVWNLPNDGFIPSDLSANWDVIDALFTAPGLGLTFSGDTNIYRWAAGQLKTDGKFRIGSNTSSALILEGTASGLTMGGDTNLYRASANALKTDGALQVVGTTSVGWSGTVWNFISSATGVGFNGTSPIAKPAHPVTLADVINVLTNYGLTA